MRGVVKIVEMTKTIAARFTTMVVLT